MQILKANALEKAKEKSRQSWDPNQGLQPKSMFSSSSPHFSQVKSTHTVEIIPVFYLNNGHSSSPFLGTSEITKLFLVVCEPPVTERSLLIGPVFAFTGL